ncbi:hypothetical protein AKO1_010173 [Acrasis kona]|uniref:Uncharacterized protein n=1 Tax=Acrasis kona TaxID=1008807 RepID=A0AAW2ZRD5_9EUKA
MEQHTSNKTKTTNKSRCRNVLGFLFSRSITEERLPRKKVLLSIITNELSKRDYTCEWEKETNTNVVLLDHFHFKDFAQVYNSEGCKLHQLETPHCLSTLPTLRGRRKTNHYKSLLCCEHSYSTTNRYFGLTASSHLIQLSTLNGRILKTRDDRSMVLCLSQIDAGYTHKTLFWSKSYDSFYCTAHTKDGFELIVFQIKPQEALDFQLSLKCKLMIPKIFYGSELKRIQLIDDMILLINKNDFVHFYSLAHLIQEYSILTVDKHANLFDFYGHLAKALPITVQITSKPHPLYCHPFSQTAYFDFGGFPMYMITKGKDIKSSGRTKSTFEVRLFSHPDQPKPCCKVEHIQDEQTTCPQDFIFYDRHNRLMHRRSKSIDVYSITKRHLLELVYSIDAQDFVLQDEIHGSDQRTRRGLRNIQRVNYRPEEILNPNILSIEYDDELDLMLILVSNGYIYVIRNIDGGVIRRFKCKDYRPDEVNHSVFFYEDQIIYMCGGSKKSRVQSYKLTNKHV